MTTTTNVAQVKLNVMTQSQYNSATKNPTELYMITDAKVNYNDLDNKPVVDQTYSGTSTNAQSGVAVKSAIDSAISSVYKPAGSIAFASRPTPGASYEGDVYNITDAFTTDSTFVEGAGINYPAGTNIVCINTSGSTYKWDVLAGLVDLSGYQTLIDSSHKLSADLVDDTSTTHKFVTASDKTTWSGKQDALVSGTNIKTVNNTSLLGSGNITVSSLPDQTGNSGKYLTTDGTDASWGDSVTVTESSLKTIEGNSILGSGNITILPDQTSQSGKFLTTDGTDVSWATVITSQVNSDWNASSGVAEILNKPTIPTINNTANYVPYKSGTSTFSDSSLLYNSNAMAFTNKLHIGSSSPTSYYSKGTLTIYNNSMNQLVNSIALLNYGGGEGSGVSVDMYNTSANGGIPSGRFALIDNGSYSGYLQLQVKKSGAAGNPLLPAMNIVPLPASNSMTTCISFGKNEYGNALFDLHKPEAIISETGSNNKWSGSGTTYTSTTGHSKFLVAAGDTVYFTAGTEAKVTSFTYSSSTVTITTDVTLGTISNQSLIIKKAYAKVTDESNNTKVIIDAYGKLGIGTVSPTYDIDVVGDINASNDIKINGVSIATEAYTASEIETLWNSVA